MNQFRRTKGLLRQSENSRLRAKNKELRELILELQATQKRAQRIAENAERWDWEVDAKGLYTFVSPVIENILGYTPLEVEGKLHFFTFFPEQERDAMKSEAFEVFGKKESFRGFENQGVHKDGHTVWLSTSGVPKLSEDGTLLGYSGADINITQRKNAEEEKELLEERLRQSQKLDAVGTLAGGIAHDFRNYLGALKNGLILLKRRANKDRKIIEPVEEMELAGSRPEDLSQQLLTFSKGGTPIKKCTPIEDIVTEAATLALTGSNCDVRFGFQPNLRWVEVDTVQLRQAILNVVANAQQSMISGGTIFVSAQNYNLSSHAILKEGEYVLIEVRDSGQGIPEDDLKRILVPFYTTKDRGTGMGLPITYGIIKSHEGTVEIESKLGKGTSVSMYLPAFEAQQENLACEGVQETVREAKKRIMILEDDESYVASFKLLLEDLGYETVVVEEGSRAAKLYEERMADNPFNLAILDLTNRYGWGGIQAKDAIRKADPDAKLIVISGYSDDPILSNYEENGFDGQLGKPFEFDELESILNRLLE